MGEYMSKGTGVTLGTLGTIGFGLTAAQALSGGNGLLGGLFGGGNQMTAMASEIAKLKSEKYADHVGIDTYAQTRRENQDLSDRLLGNWIKPIAQESAANRERVAILETQVQADREKAALREKLVMAELEKRDMALNGKIDRVADHTSCGISRLSDGFAALRNAVDKITVTHIPASAICPEVMPRYNSWTSVEGVAAPAVQPVSGTIRTA